MAETLFPVFDVPEIKISNPAAEKKYLPSVYFDYDTGDFRSDAAHRMVVSSGREAYCQWCLAAVHTERGSCLAYGQNFGVEMQAALKQPTDALIESEVERTIREALEVNPRTEYVQGFIFARDSDRLSVSFTVKGYEWDEEVLTTAL